MGSFYILALSSNLIIACLAPGIIRLENKEASIVENQLWTSQLDKNSSAYYICNDLYKTCIGTLREEHNFELLNAEDKSKATGGQLLWKVNNDGTISSIIDQELQWNVVNRHFERYAPLQLYKAEKPHKFSFIDRLTGEQINAKLAKMAQDL